MPDASTPRHPFFSDFSRAFRTVERSLLSTRFYPPRPTRFNLRNTPAINARAIKNRCPKGTGVPAFAHLLGVVLVELGLHQPLAAAFGWQGEGELTLARKIFARQSLPDRCLILADRLFGLPSLIRELMPLLEKSVGAVLFRVKSNLKTTRIRQLALDQPAR
jgi:hypothetical protein